MRSSRRLHWTQDAARCEAEAWASEIGLESPSWETIDKTGALAWAGTRAFVLRSMRLPPGNALPSEGRGWAAFLFAPGAGTIVHPAFGVVRGAEQLQWTQKAACEEAESWAREMQLGPLDWEMIDETGAIAWIAHGAPRAFVVRSILLPHGAPQT